jgi:hypothetical protein
VVGEVQRLRHEQEEHLSPVHVVDQLVLIDGPCSREVRDLLTPVLPGRAILDEKHPERASRYGAR